MTSGSPTIPRIPIPYMVRSNTVQVRPRAAPSPPLAPEKPKGPYIPFADRGPYVISDPGPYWLKLGEDETDNEADEEEEQKKKKSLRRSRRGRRFADRDPYVASAIGRPLIVPDRSPTVSPVSALNLPAFDSRGHTPAEPRDINIISERLGNLKCGTPVNDADRFADPLEEITPKGPLHGHRSRRSRPQTDLRDCMARSEDPPIPIHNIFMHSRGTEREYVRAYPTSDPNAGDHIHLLPEMPRSQTLYYTPSVSYSHITPPLHEDNLDIFAGFDGVGWQGVPIIEKDDMVSVIVEPSQTRRATPARRVRRVDSVPELMRPPSNPDFGPIRFERSRTGLTYLNLEDQSKSRDLRILGANRFRGAEDQEYPEVQTVGEVAVERLRKPKFKHRIHYLSGKITRALSKMRGNE